MNHLIRQLAPVPDAAWEAIDEEIRPRLETHLAVHNETRSPWGPIDLRLSVGTWSAKDGRNFGEFLDSVEAGLRQVSMPEKVRAPLLHHSVRG